MKQLDVPGRTMTHVLILDEGEESGLAVWRFAASRDEAAYVHAERLQDDWDAGLSPNERLQCVWARAFWKPWTAVDLGYFDAQQYALYLPCSQRDFVLVCYGSGTYGNGSYREMLWLEKWQWQNLYQQREEKLAITEEEKQRHRDWLERFGA